MSNKIWDIQNLILDLSIFSVYGHGAWYMIDLPFSGQYCLRGSYSRLYQHEDATFRWNGPTVVLHNILKRTMCFHNLSSILPWKGRNPDPFEQTLIPSTQRGVLPSSWEEDEMWKVYNNNVNNDDENDDEDRQGTTTTRKVHLRHKTTSKACLVILLHWRETEKKITQSKKNFNFSKEKPTQLRATHISTGTRWKFYRSSI